MCEYKTECNDSINDDTLTEFMCRYRKHRMCLSHAVSFDWQNNKKEIKKSSLQV